MGDLDIHTRAQHILHAERISARRKSAPERPMPCRAKKADLGKSVQVLEVPCAALITLVMISNPAAVVGRPEANGHAPVPPHDALCTRLNPLVPPKEPMV